MKRGPAWLSPTPYALILAVVIAGTAGGCALAERAEALFLRQQDVQGALASTLSEVETAQPALAERLYGLEDDLHTACRPLREAGRRRFEGQDLDSDLEWAVMTSLQECESTTRTVERLVQQAGTGNLGPILALETLPAGFDGR